MGKRAAAHCDSDAAHSLIGDRLLGARQISGLKRGVGWRYDHHEYLDEKRRALELWERRLLSIVSGSTVAGERWQN